MKRIKLIMLLLIVLSGNMLSQKINLADLINVDLLFRYKNKTFVFKGELININNIEYREVNDYDRDFVASKTTKTYKTGEYSYKILEFKSEYRDNEINKPSWCYDVDQLRFISVSDKLYSCDITIKYDDKDEVEERIKNFYIHENYDYYREGKFYVTRTLINYHLTHEGFLFLNFVVKNNNIVNDNVTYFYIFKYDTDANFWNVVYENKLHCREFFDYQQISYDREKRLAVIEVYGVNQFVYYQFEIRDYKLTPLIEEYAYRENTR